MSAVQQLPLLEASVPLIAPGAFVRKVITACIEVIVPAWVDAVPEDLQHAFRDHEWFDAGGSQAFAIFGCELRRGLTDKEAQALDEAMLAQDILLYQVLTL